MAKEIIVKDNLEKQDDDLIPFPRHFAECVAGILSKSDSVTVAKPKDKITFKSSFGLTIR